MQYDVCINSSIQEDKYECLGCWKVDDNIEVSDRWAFMEYIYAGIDNGSIKTYKDKNKTIEIKSTEDIILRYDTALYYDPTGKERLAIIETKMFISDLAGIRFIEDWYFDIEKQNFIKEVKAIGFLVPSFNFMKQGLEETAIFWIFFD